MTLEEFMTDLRLAEIERRLDAIEEAFREDTVAMEGEGAAAFTGVYWFYGKKYELGKGSKAFWYHDASNNTSHWSHGPMPDPMHDNQFWRETNKCGPVEYIRC